MTLETYIRAQLARFALEEGGRHGGVTNMLAIAMVMRNRVFAGWGDWIEVISRAPEKRGTIYKDGDAIATRMIRSGAARVLLNRIDEVYTRQDLEDLTGGALFYVQPDLPIAMWFQREILERPDDHPRTAHIGPVWFFQ